MRALQCDDLFLLSEIVDLMDIQISQTGGTQEEIGMQLLLNMAKSIYKAKSQIYSLLAEINSKTVDEISQMPASEVLAMFKTLISSEDLLSFFK